MKLNKQLKIEGIVIIICCMLMIIALILYHAIMIFQSPLFVLVVIAVLIYWIYQVARYQKQH